MEALSIQETLLPSIPPGEDELPYDFGPPMESSRHVDCMNLIIEVLRLHWADRPLGYVAGNMAMYFNELQVHKNDFLGPDVFAVSDATRRERKSWVVWQEGLTPDVVIELLSAGTEARDRGEKKAIYARALRVPDYVLFDPWDGRLESWRLIDGQYQPITPDEAGRVSVSSIGLKLGVLWELRDGERWPWLRWFNEDGILLPTPAELERMKADEERARADEERARADEERARADEERARAEAAERRAEELAARLRALGIDPDR